MSHVVIGNSVYRLVKEEGDKKVEAAEEGANAVLQALLSQYETAADTMAKALKNSYQAAMGKNFTQAKQVLDKYLDCKNIEALKELSGDMEAAVAMG